MELADPAAHTRYPLERRRFVAMIAGGVLIAPLTGEAQPAAKAGFANQLIVGGPLDHVDDPSMDLLLAFPPIVLALMCVSVVGPAQWLIVLVVGLSQMPQTARLIRAAVVQVPVLVEAKPSRAIAERAPNVTPEMLGLFVGTTVGEKVYAPSGYPNVVLLFQRNLERAGRSRSEVSKEIKITLLHEYGHYLGFDEEELEHLGLG